MDVARVSKKFYKAPRFIARVPIEIWDSVQSYLPSFFSSALRRSLLYKPTNIDDHHRIWNYLFKSDVWLNAAYEAGLNPCLVGCDLYPLLYDKYEEFDITKKGGKMRKPLYLCLILGREGSFTFKPSAPDEELNRLFYHCLRQYESKAKHDIIFANGLRLNISDVDQNFSSIIVHSPRQLVSRRIDGLHSAYLYWKDTDPTVRNIHPKDVFGIGKGLTKKNVSRIVGLNWKHFPSGKDQQHTFAISTMVDQAEPVTTDGKVTGYKWLLEWSVLTDDYTWKSNVAASKKKRHREVEMEQRRYYETYYNR